VKKTAEGGSFFFFFFCFTATKFFLLSSRFWSLSLSLSAPYLSLNLFLAYSSKALTRAESQESMTASSPNHLAADVATLALSSPGAFPPSPPLALLRGAWKTPSNMTFSAPGRVAAESGTTPVFFVFFGVEVENKSKGKDKSEFFVRERHPFEVIERKRER
jgi:hypothetical protein